MKKTLNLLISKLDIEKLRYVGLSGYKEVIGYPENCSDIEKDLPYGKKIKDIKIEYKETSIHIGESTNEVFVYFDLFIDDQIIGYYKYQYFLVDSELEPIDDFLMIF